MKAYITTTMFECIASAVGQACEDLAIDYQVVTIYYMNNSGIEVDSFIIRIMASLEQLLEAKLQALKYLEAGDEQMAFMETTFTQEV